MSEILQRTDLSGDRTGKRVLGEVEVSKRGESTNLRGNDAGEIVIRKMKHLERSE